MSLAFRKKFKKYTWGMGLEHEMHLFHMKKNRKTNITSFTLYDGELARRRLLDEYNNDKIDISLKKTENLVPYSSELKGNKYYTNKLITKEKKQQLLLVLKYPDIPQGYSILFSF